MKTTNLRKVLLLMALLIHVQANLVNAQVNFAEKLDSIVYSDGSVARYAYYPDGTLDSIVNKYGITRYTYETGGAVVETQISGNSKIVYHYKNRDKKQSTLIEVFNKNDNGQWSILSKSVIEFDSKDREANSKSYNFNSSSGNMYLSSERIYDYDLDNECYSCTEISYSEESGVNGSLIPYVKDENVYSKNSILLAKTRYVYYNGEWIKRSQDTYSEEGIHQSNYWYKIENGIVTDVEYEKYDEKGNVYERKYDSYLYVYDNSYNSNGKLKEVIEYEIINGEKRISYKKVYIYNSFMGIEEAYVVEHYGAFMSVGNGTFTWIDEVTSRDFYIPHIKDGKVCDYMYASVDRYGHVSSPYNFSYSNSKDDLLLEYRWFLINKDAQIIERQKELYTYSDDGIRTSFTLYRNPTAKEFTGELQFDSKTEYIYDWNVKGSTISGFEEQYKHLYDIKTNANGEKTVTAKYHYSDISSTGITLTKAQANKGRIYDLQGKSVNTVEAGKIYITNGKKYVAK